MLKFRVDRRSTVFNSRILSPDFVSSSQRTATTYSTRFAILTEEGPGEKDSAKSK